MKDIARKESANRNYDEMIFEQEDFAGAYRDTT